MTMIELVSFEALIGEFLQAMQSRKHISFHTSRSYKTDLAQFHSFWRDNQACSLYPLLFEEAFKKYLHQLHQRALEKRSIARKFSCFSSFVKFLHQKGYAIAVEIKRPTFERKLPQPISPQELDELLSIHHEALPTSFPLRDKAIIEILYATGITSSELVRITLADIDLTNKVLRIVGKKDKVRLVFFGTMAHDRLLDYLKYERKLGCSSDEALFFNNTNTPLTTRAVQKICAMFKKFLHHERSFTPHTLRHSFATHLIENGTDKKDLKELLGYVTFLSTEQYAHVIPKSSNENEF